MKSASISVAVAAPRSRNQKFNGRRASARISRMITGANVILGRDDSQSSCRGSPIADRRYRSLRFAAGDAQKYFFEAEFVLPQSSHAHAILHQRFGEKGGVNVVIGKRDLHLAVDGDDLGHFRPGAKNFEI